SLSSGWQSNACCPSEVLKKIPPSCLNRYDCPVADTISHTTLKPFATAICWSSGIVIWQGVTLQSTETCTRHCSALVHSYPNCGFFDGGMLGLRLVQPNIANETN